MKKASRRGASRHQGSGLRSVAVITGTRAEFGLLCPVIDAVRKHAGLRLQLIAAGAHFLPPARTIREVEGAFPIAARVPMQRPGKTGRLADSAAVARGIDGFTRAFTKLKPDWVVVLGDRIEAFAAAAAASIGGLALAHIHGGDRAEGVADEPMRHAITKLAHLHLPATLTSATRIMRMGEAKERVRVVGSPAMDGLRGAKPLGDRRFAEVGSPRAVVLMHPAGLGPQEEEDFTLAAIVTARRTVEATANVAPPLLLLAPNLDPGRAHVMAALRYAHRKRGWPLVDHLPRTEFLALLARLARDGGVLVGNSSAGLIEAAALGVPVVNVGPRQAGRERAGNVIDLRGTSARAISEAVRGVRARVGRAPREHPYGDGRAGERIAEVLSSVDPHGRDLLRKRCTY